MKKRATARIRLLPAKDTPIVVILRRKPTKWFHVMTWNTETDAIEHGSWFHGRLCPQRCDVSFDGVWMVYAAFGAWGNTWSGVCRLPWLKTLGESQGMSDLWSYGGGGGYWTKPNRLLLNGWSLGRTTERLPFRTKQLTGCDVLLRRWERDGWIAADEGAWSKWYCAPTSRHPELHATLRDLSTPDRTFEFSLAGYPELLSGTIDWAAWDAAGQLIVARDGAVEKYGLADLKSGQPATRISFEDLTPPRQL